MKRALLSVLAAVVLAPLASAQIPTAVNTATQGVQAVEQFGFFNGALNGSVQSQSGAALGVGHLPVPHSPVYEDPRKTDYYPGYEPKYVYPYGPSTATTSNTATLGAQVILQHGAFNNGANFAAQKQTGVALANGNGGSASGSNVGTIGAQVIAQTGEHNNASNIAIQDQSTLAVSGPFFPPLPVN